MPQEFCVLKCYSCNTFQVHIKKSSKKWNCKMCGETQTLIKVFAQGSAKDCREHVQKCNMVKGMAEIEINDKVVINEDFYGEVRPSNEREQEVDDIEENDDGNITINGRQQSQPISKPSKWTCFLDSDTE